MKHLFSVQDVTTYELYDLFHQAREYRFQSPKINQQVFIANLFFEPSTRTKMGFTVAEKKLGLDILDFDASTSSLKKGESLYDTVKTIEAIGANVLVIRDKADDWMSELKDCQIPIINAGAGKRAHPTQSILDAFTIHEEFGRIEGLNIVIAGDVVHSRVAHSNIKLLTNLGAKVSVTGAPEFKDPSVRCPYIPMDEAVEECDVMMLLRIQHERHNEKFNEATYLENQGLTIAREKRMKKEAIILHPAPVNRGVEIDESLVEGHRSRIFKQMENGVYIRMAIIVNQLIKWGIIDENQIEKRNVSFREQRIKPI